MNKEKLYFCRYYDQWKGKDIKLVEDEKNTYILYVQVPDVDMAEGSINMIYANFSTSDDTFIETVMCEYDSNTRIINLIMPKFILTNNGLYKVNFNVEYNKNGSNKTDEKSAIQTFTIIDTIDIDDSEIENDDRYGILQDMIDELGNYKIDTSNFPSKEEMQNAIDTAMEDVTIENIMAQLQGNYTTPQDVTKTIEAYGFAQKVHTPTYETLSRYVETTKLNERLRVYAQLSELSKYVEREQGKQLSSNDFTNELKDKLVNMPDKGVEFDDTELREMIDKKASRDFVLELFGDIQSIDLTKYYTIEEMTTIIDEINKTHSTNIDNLEDDVENIYLKKEDYEYADGINTDDVKVNEEQSLTQLIEELKYKEIEIEDFKTTYISNIREYGDTFTYVDFEWKLNKNPISQTLTDTMGTLSNNARNYHIGQRYTTNKTFILTVTDEKVTKEKAITIQFVYPYLYGSFTEENLLLNTLENGNKIIDVKNNQTIKLSYTDASVFFAYPSSYGNLEDIKDGNGLSYFDDFILQTSSIRGENYNVYILQEKATVSNISFSFIFGKEEK